jgi:type IV secretion system protein VirB6
MGFFAEFNTWLNAILSTYIATNTARIATLLEPTVVTLAVLYVMIWGYLHLMGQIEEPFTAGVKRIMVLAVVLGASLDLWLYNQVIVDTFFTAPSELAAGIVGAYDPVSVVDQILFSGGDAGSLLLQKGGVFHGSFSYALAGVAVYLIVGVTAVYTMFLLALSRIALSVLLALGPLFIALLFFQTTKRFFEAWIAQLANYALITILTVLLAALMMTVVSTAAQQAVSTGGGITIAEAARVCVAAGLTFLVMRQVMPMAAGLASGLALSTFGVVSAAMMWGLGRGGRIVGQFGRGLVMDRETTRWDGLSRKAGYALQRGAVGGWRRATAPWRENSIGGGRT